MSPIDNLRGSLLMVAAMIGFALEDMLIKQLAAEVPMGQVLALIGCGGALIFGALTLASGRRLLAPALVSRAVVLRNLGEVVASVCFVAALVLTTLSNASAILQALPLAVTLGAALFLGESVGWRRWSAIAAGFAGVLLVVQPGLAGFRPASLLAVVAVAALAVRDLSSRAVPRDVTSAQLSVWAFVSIIPAGLAMMLVMGTPAVMPGAPDLARLGGVFVVSSCGYYALVGATRTGEVSVVVPFRYTRLVFAMIIGAAVFDERPGPLMLAGAALIVGSGLYTIVRDRARSRAVSATRA